jgi:gas vesicle protein
MREYDDLPYIVIERRGDGGAFLLGVLVGAGVALLLAPRAGAEVRGEFVRAALGVRGAVGDRVEGVRGAVDARREQARSAVRTGREAARDARADLLRRVAEAKILRRAPRGGVDAPAPPAADVVVVSVGTETGAGDLAR